MLFAFLSLLVILFVIISVFNFIANTAQMQEMGYAGVYYKNLSVTFVTGLICFATVFLLFLVNSLMLRKNIIKIWENTAIMQKKRVSFLLSAVFALIFAFIYAPKISPLFLQYICYVPFNRVDPILGQDISYYVFQRPFLNLSTDAVQFVLFMQIIYSFAIYSICYLRTDFTSYKDLFSETKIVNHLLVNLIIYFISMAFSFKFMLEEILFGEFVNLNGAGFTDVYIWLNYYRIFPIFMLITIGASIIFIKKTWLKRAVITLCLVPLFFGVTFIISAVTEIWFVKPYEASMQQLYISYNIDATKYGFNLSSVAESEFDADLDLTFRDLEENSSTIDNIRITDIKQTLVSTNALQSITNFYSFTDSDIISYDINGKKTAINVSARESDLTKLPPSNQSYINKKLRFTHGYGIVASDVNKITEEGQPQFLVKDIPIKSEITLPNISRPQIYYGEKTNDYAIVGTTYSELDFAVGDLSFEHHYSGSGGIELNLLNRLAFSINKLDPMILLSGYINDNSRLLTNRNILQRVQKIAPFLSFDTDPYIIISDSGELLWVIDIYTTSSRIPYSQKYNGINYIRNSGKAIVDAYTGEVTFYITDSADPIISAFGKMYPGLFSYNPLPDYVKKQMRYPEYIFKLQSDVYKTYHVTNPETFYSNSDLWAYAKEKYSGDETMDVAPYYNLMNLDGVDDLVIMQPFTPRGKDNLIAWAAASSREESYGKMTVYHFPKGKTVYGTMHIENKIDNDPNISREISLWSQGDSKVVRGSIMVIPIKNSLLYVEPIYVTAKNSAALPEIKKIIVAYGDKVAMESTLHEALYVLFGMKEPTISSGNTEEITPDTLTRDIIAKYEELILHSKNQNYKEFGDALDEMGKLISKLKEIKAEEDIKTTEE